MSEKLQDEKFKTYCKDIYIRTIARKGCRLENGEVVYYTEGSSTCIRDRCQHDPRLMPQLEEKVCTSFRRELDTRDFNLDLLDYMVEVAIDRKENPRKAPMPIANRQALQAGRNVVVTSQDGNSGSSVPRSSIPGFTSFQSHLTAGKGLPTPWQDALDRKGDSRGKGTSKSRQARSHSKGGRAPCA